MWRARHKIIAAAGALLLAGGCQQALSAAPMESFVNAPAPTLIAHEPAGKAQAIFAGGCYWGVEGVFSHVVGVSSAVSGFHGGSAATAEYERVSAGDTGHAESVRVTYDPAKIRYDQLLRIYFSVIADPTERDRQGPDVGTQYRSALVPLNPEQRRVATAYLAQLRAANLWHRPIVTAIEPYRQFYPAAADHQDFMANNPDYPYTTVWDAPRIDALKRLFPAEYHASFTRG
jgi:peptide-methionine (S)-S-oxide reductase